MNYGLTQMNIGQYAAALNYFEQAKVYTPAYSLLEINLGIANSGLGRDSEAENHFQRALRLAPDAVVVQRGDDTMIEVSTFDPLRGRMVIQRTVHREGAARHASYFVRLPTPPEWVVWLEAAGFRDVTFRAGGGGPLELDSWELVVVATA